MAKYLRKFETTAEYTAAESTLVKPNVSYIVEGNEVHYKPYVKETKLVVYYDIQDISSPTTIFTNFDNSVKSIEVDGKETISEFSGPYVTYEFNSVGEHVIKYEFNNPTSVGNSAPLFNSIPIIKRAVIADTFTSIGNEAFNGCTGLTSVTIGSGVTSIGNGAFCGCTGLTSINIPDSVTSIGEQAFIDCTSLISVTIGSGVTSIGEQAFIDCTSLTSVTVEATTPPTLGSGAFETDAEERKIYVPSASVNAYKAAENWSDYAEDIEAIPSV